MDACVSNRAGLPETLPDRHNARVKMRSWRAAVVLAAVLTTGPLPTGASAAEPPPLPERAIEIIEAIEGT